GSGTSHRALPHGLLHQLLHPGQFICCGWTIHAAHYVPPHLRGANIRAQIYAAALPLQPAKIAVKVTPVYSQMKVLEKIVAVSNRPVVLWSNRSAFARNSGGNPLR